MYGRVKAISLLPLPGSIPVDGGKTERAYRSGEKDVGNTLLSEER